MGIFVAWMRAKAMASGAVAPKGKGKQQGVVLVEYLILAGGVIATVVSVQTYWDNIETEFSNLAASVVGLVQ